MAQQLAVGPGLNVTECIETELNFLNHKFVSRLLGYLEERPFV
jgi:hypothetical protein